MTPEPARMTLKISAQRSQRKQWLGIVFRLTRQVSGLQMKKQREILDFLCGPWRSSRLCGKELRFLVTNKLTLDRFCEDWRIKLMCTSGPCPRSALEESSNGIGGHRPYRGHGPLVHNPCPGQWFYPSLFGSGSSGLGLIVRQIFIVQRRGKTPVIPAQSLSSNALIGNRNPVRCSLWIFVRFAHS